MSADLPPSLKLYPVSFSPAIAPVMFLTFAGSGVLQSQFAPIARRGRFRCFSVLFFVTPPGLDFRAREVEGPAVGGGGHHEWNYHGRHSGGDFNSLALVFS